MENETVDYGKVTGMVHSTESFGAVDGPGIRFIVFLQGCQMRCQYCHNPDTWAMETNKSRERTVDDVLEEALRYRGFWGQKGGITVSGGEVLAVACQEHETEAREFVRYMAEPEQTSQYIESMGYLSARKDLLKAQIQNNPEKKACWDYLKEAKLREREAYWPSLSMELAESINRVILGQDEPEELEQLSERINRIRRESYEKE